ncbi:hypothetical protein DMH01_03430 [Amycolatopsis sp. WAC 04182]|uniref:zinc finger domain-containing protein n=1 Tax=Amycolatopsis sp. WAC 04182 TaxID=2203198 RepID=UPI000F78FA27|nr:hypothetical protein [Amycolatopsis sp. WAC 04182]RSN65441.1 hypothetical protein DMH01_03430 [Amycolatopsis sp. WAC 04182]
MTEEEIRAVLAAAMGYDNRRPGELNVVAWQEASEIGRWTLGEAVEAVHQHYAVSTNFLMPAHITERIRNERRHAPLPAERQIETAPPASDERRAEFMAQIAQIGRLPAEETQKSSPSDRERRVACPHEPCKAGVGRPCGRRVTRPGVHQGEFREIAGYHPSRIEAVKRQEQA